MGKTVLDIYPNSCIKKIVLTRSIAIIINFTFKNGLPMSFISVLLLAEVPLESVAVQM